MYAIINDIPAVILVKKLIKLSLYLGAELAAHLIGLCGTESAYSIWEEKYIASLNTYYNSDIDPKEIYKEYRKLLSWTSIKNKLGSVKILFTDCLDIISGTSTFEPDTAPLTTKLLTTIEEYFTPSLKEKRLNEYRRFQIKNRMFEEWVLDGKREKEKLECVALVKANNKKHWTDFEATFDKWYHYILYSQHYHTGAIILFVLSSLFLLKLNFNYLWLKICDYETRLSLTKGKLPKFKYIGAAGKKLKDLVGHNIDEIQIGVNNTILTDLYNVPPSKQIFIQMPELCYSRKGLINSRIVLNTLGYHKRYPSYTLNYISVNTK
jgi:hypothetical protein